MTGKPAQYQPPIDIKPTLSYNHEKIYPGAPETTARDFRGIEPTFYWSASISDAIAFLYQRGPEGLVYKNAKDIGNPDKGIDPKKLHPGSNKYIWWKCSKGHTWKELILEQVNQIKAVHIVPARDLQKIITFKKNFQI